LLIHGPNAKEATQKVHFAPRRSAWLYFRRLWQFGLLRGGPLPPEAEDGILTAEDVSGMNLLDTEFVALSACETGLGEVRTGGEVFGLRRSFVLAGARGLVMSSQAFRFDPQRKNFFRGI
jgi:hypothetical protein